MTRRETVVQLLEGARHNNHRQLLVVAGDRDWTIAQAEQIQNWLCAEPDTYLWVSQQAPAGSTGVGSRDLHRYLGRETELLIFDAWDGFNPNAFGQISGTLCGGGLLV
ncbi:tRNA(Met) cytidine acetyltransferase TmcA domain-containing protein, partial [Pontibacterium sp.]|uniref:tRNA(Met) cytidine acetyltransferase TmcA domain-containing protein n=1 Tax=Pontibacterium sp. TaxID=2036026 RepID=UPI0035664735